MTSHNTGKTSCLSPLVFKCKRLPPPLTPPPPREAGVGGAFLSQRSGGGLSGKRGGLSSLPFFCNTPKRPFLNETPFPFPPYV